MRNKNNGDVGTIVRDDEAVEAALAAGVRDALRRHLQAGQPVVEWRDGKSVWLGPDEIRKRITRMTKKKNRKNAGT